jgi:DNA-binding CsgD family transcriptional regulator
MLLAKGRNSRVIQKELHISYNTAKAHVRHIYTKLGVHSQQELIDLVETAD